MGSKISKAVRRPHVDKAAASTLTATSHHDEPQTGSRQDVRLPDIKGEEPLANDTSADVATSSTDNHNNQVPADAGAMEVEQRLRDSTDSRAGSLLRSLQELPDELPPPPPPVVLEPTLLPPPPPPPPAVSCLICCTGFTKDNEDKQVKPCRCGSSYCVSCLRGMFIDSCKDLTRMPPRCCNQIPLHHARPHLTEKEADGFRAKYEEWSTPNPFYCPVARCSTFIPNRLLPQTRLNHKGKQRVDSGIGTPTSVTVACPKCETDICTNCRNLAHADAPCTPLEFGIDKETAELLKRWGYKRCPKCANGVKRMFGCNHMECRCGAHFCWVCLKSRDDCDGGCYDDDEEYDSDEEPDRESDADENEPPSENPHNTETPAAEDVASGETVAQSVENPEPAQEAQPAEGSADTQPTPPQPTRVRNLDGGSGRYWEEQDFDFGREPTDDIQDRHWDCVHNFKTAKVSLADSLRNAPSATSMECMKCWSAIHPEVEMPNSISTGGARTVSPAASGRHTRGRGRRIRGRGGMRNPCRDEALAAFASSVPEVTFLSQSNPFSEPMEDVQYTASQPEDANGERVVDTYGNTITTTEKLDETRRASLDIPTFTRTDDDELDAPKPDWLQGFVPIRNSVRIAPKLLDLATGSTPFSFAFECYHCQLLVCNYCKDNLLEAQEQDEDEGTVDGN